MCVGVRWDFGRQDLLEIVEVRLAFHPFDRKSRLLPTKRFHLSEISSLRPFFPLMVSYQCIGGHGLSIICRMLSEEYGHRNSGVPDLMCVVSLPFSRPFPVCRVLETDSPALLFFLSVSSASGTTRNDPFDGSKSKDLATRFRRRKKSGST